MRVSRGFKSEVFCKAQTNSHNDFLTTVFLVDSIINFLAAKDMDANIFPRASISSANFEAQDFFSGNAETGAGVEMVDRSYVQNRTFRPTFSLVLSNFFKMLWASSKRVKKE